MYVFIKLLKKLYLFARYDQIFYLNKIHTYGGVIYIFEKNTEHLKS